MKKNIVLALISISLITTMAGQKYFTKTGEVSFFSRTNMENIDAITNNSNCVLDLTTGNVEMAVLVKSFTFEKALMQEHFNENYMESTKYPKAIFKGNIKNIGDFNMNFKGSFKGAIEGMITIHGVTKPFDNVVNLNVKDGKIKADIDFNVKLAEFDIKVPALVKDNISKEIKVTVAAMLEEFKTAK